MEVNRVAEIVRLEADYEKLSEEAEANRWETARLYAEELADGKSQRALAREVGKDEKHVRLMRKCWELRGLKSAPEDRPQFNTVYNSTEVRGEPKPRTEPGPGPEEDPAEAAHQWAVRAEASVTRELGRATEPNSGDVWCLANILGSVQKFLDPEAFPD